MSATLPIIHGRTQRRDGSRTVEDLDLEFSNGERRLYHRVLAAPLSAVLVIPLLDADTVLLVREYAAGSHRYELGLVKGRMDPGETPLEAANRELMEEVGFGARDLHELRRLSLAPTYMQHEAHVVVARELYPQSLPGDEPEPLEQVPWRWDRLHELVLEPSFSDGRSVAALFLVREWLRHGGGR